MTQPPKTIHLLTLLQFVVMLVILSGCSSFWDGFRKGVHPPLIVTPRSTEEQPPVVFPAPDSVYDPPFEDPSTIVPWARPFMPENAFNSQISPNNRYFVYIGLHPGTRLMSLYSVELAGGAPNLLHGATKEESIFYFSITPDSERVIYYEPFGGTGLYSVGITGTDQITLTDHQISEMALSADGQWIVYWGGSSSQRNGLYSMPISGGKPVLLGNGLPQSGSYQITPDSRYVIFVSRRAETVDAPLDLYSIPIQGGVPIRLNDGVNTSYGSSILVTPDSQRVIFGYLYSVPILGGSPQQLNQAPGGPKLSTSFSPQLSPDGRWLLYLAGEPNTNQDSLFVVPSTGGPSIQLNGPLAPGESIQNVKFSQDGEHVFYGQGVPGQGVPPAYYLVPLTGGTTTLLPTSDFIHPSLDGRWYVSMVRAGDAPGIYSTPTDGGAPIKLETPIPTNSEIAWLQISPDSRTVVYATSKDVGGFMPVFDGLYQIPIAGGNAVEITGVDGQDRVHSFGFIPNSSTILVHVDYDGNGRAAGYVLTLPPEPAPISPLPTVQP